MSEHKLLLRVRKHKIYLSCACRETKGKHSKAGVRLYSYIAETTNFDQTREYYNDPENHWAPFTDEDRIGGDTSRRR